MLLWRGGQVVFYDGCGGHGGVAVLDRAHRNDDLRDDVPIEPRG
jgi:hypothetical protein